MYVDTMDIEIQKLFTLINSVIIIIVLCWMQTEWPAWCGAGRRGGTPISKVMDACHKKMN